MLTKIRRYADRVRSRLTFAHSFPIFHIQGYVEGDEHASTGNAFLVEKNLLVTCAHVVAPGASLMFLNRRLRNFKLRCLKRDEESDIAILSASAALRAPSVSKARAAPIVLGQQIVLFGYLERDGVVGIETIPATFIRELRRCTLELYPRLSNGTNLFPTNGLSGSPLLNSRGEYVGMFTGRSQNSLFGVSATKIRQTLNLIKS